MTKFKVGDRVRLTGKKWAKEYPALAGQVVTVHGHHKTDGEPFFDDVDAGRMYIANMDGDDWTGTLVEPAPPSPDTRKRLREYMDLRTGDEVDIAGVTLTVQDWSSGDTTLIDEGKLYLPRRGIVDNMLVDEVRRSPKMKKRRVYEEVDVHDKAASFATPDGRGWRLIEETEVPR